jgi:hypothetical protein
VAAKNSQSLDRQKWIVYFITKCKVVGHPPPSSSFLLLEDGNDGVQTVLRHLLIIESFQFQ